MALLRVTVRATTLVLFLALLPASPALAWGPTPGCDNEDVLARSFFIVRTDGSNFATADMSGRVEEGDRITATLKLAPECADELFSLVSYEAPSATFSRHTAHLQEVFDFQTKSGSPARAGAVFELVLGPVRVPGCYFQVDLVRGEIIRRFGPAESDNFYSAQGRLLDADTGGDNVCRTPPPPPPVPCPTSLTGTANPDGTITLNWTAAAGVDGHRVHRDGVLVATLGPLATSYTDNTTAAGDTHTYKVTSFAGSREATVCGAVEVTAVPFFGAPLVGALVLAACAGIYVALRRR